MNKDKVSLHNWSLVSKRWAEPHGIEWSDCSYRSLRQILQVNLLYQDIAGISLQRLFDWVCLERSTWLACVLKFNYSCWVHIKPKPNQSTIKQRAIRNSYPFREQVRKRGTDS